MSIRINRVTKECNIGLQRLVDYLHENGYTDVELNPNAKLTDEQYAVVLAKFKQGQRRSQGSASSSDISNSARSQHPETTILKGLPLSESRGPEDSPKREIFISYSRHDLELVKAIKGEIESTTGVGCWMDLNAIESGSAQFTQDIVSGIRECRVFLFMLSVMSQKSEFALLELNFASKKAKVDRQKHVIIVNIDGCQMCDEFDFLYGLTDTIDWSNLPQKEKLLRDLKRWLG